MATLPVGLHRLEELLKHCIEIAKQMLEANGAFFPFGAVIDASGKRIMVTGDTGDASARTPDVYRLIQRSMRAQFTKGEIVAGAIVAEATMPPELNASFPEGFRVVVESNSVSRVVFVPCKRLDAENAGAKLPTPGRFEYGEYLGLNVQPTLFAADRPE
jgi:hypothetical protein